MNFICFVYSTDIIFEGFTKNSENPVNWNKSEDVFAVLYILSQKYKWNTL